MAMDVALALNKEARELDGLGIAVFQFDELVFSRYPDKIKEWGITALDRCLESVERAQTAAHICYRYPMPAVPSPIVDGYPVILNASEHLKISQLEFEFETSRFDHKPLGLCPSNVMFGYNDNSIYAIETPEHVADQLLAAAKCIPAEPI